MLNEVSQTQKDEHHMISLMWNPKQLISEKWRIAYWSAEVGAKGGCWDPAQCSATEKVIILSMLHFVKS